MIRKLAKQNEMIKHSLVVLSIVFLTYTIVLCENAEHGYVKLLIPDFILCGTAVVLCRLNSMDLKVLFSVMVIHHIGIITHCILGTDLDKYFIIDGIGLIFAFLMAVLVEYIRFKKATNAKAIMIICVVADVLTFLSLIVFGSSIGGTKAWINMFGVSFQLTELLKITYLVYSATALSTIEDPKKLFIALSVFSAYNLLTLAILNEFGTAIIILIVYFCLVWIYSSKRYFLITLFALTLMIGIVAVVDFLVCSYTQSSSNPLPVLKNLYESVFSKINVRFQLWLNPSSLDTDATYQTLRAREALTQGGLLGSKEKNPVSVPIESSDFIFTAIVENLGVITGIGIVCLFIFILVRMLRCASNTTNVYDSVSICTASLFIVITSLIMILGSTGAFVLTGVPIAFLSEGGTQTLINYSLVGVALILGSNDRRTHIIIKSILDKKGFNKSLKKKERGNKNEKSNTVQNYASRCKRSTP